MAPLAVLLMLQGPQPLADLPFEEVNGRIYLKGELNGRAVNVVLDTGATATMADRDLGVAVGG